MNDEKFFLKRRKERQIIILFEPIFVYKMQNFYLIFSDRKSFL